MKKIPFIFLLIITALYISSCGSQKSSNEQKNEEFTLFKDLTYSKGDNFELKLNIAVPDKTKEPKPLIVFFYGYAFGKGSRNTSSPLLIEATRRGYTAAAVDYRWSPEFHYPAQILDAKAAIRWLKAHADDYFIDKEKIGVDGFSSGAYLSLMLGLTEPGDGYDSIDVKFSEINSDVQAVIAHTPVTDFVWHGEDFKHKDYIGKTLAEDPELYRQASVLTYIGGNDAPVLTIHGLADNILNIEHSYRLDIEMKKRSKQHTLIVDPLGSHEWLMITEDYIWAFFDLYLKK